jgi:short subunit dehydrogenase-like uncharacterized protein
MPIDSWMIYGAYGYSAKLIAEHAKDRGLAPVLAGRNPDKTRAVAEKLGFEWRAFPLDDPGVIADNLSDIDAVIHCAGPFSATSAQMIAACLRAGAHYFDITGEIEVFEHAHSAEIDAAAKAKGIVICPGVGFDVVPTDCLAKALIEALPDATDLNLGFHGSAHVSPGTAKTVVEKLGAGTKARRNSKIVDIPLVTREIDYGRGPRQSMSISWGDVSTAYYTTGIGNITAFWPASDKMIRQFDMAGKLGWLLRRRPVQNFLKRKIEQKVRGPSEEQRNEMPVSVWAEVRNEHGQTATARMTTANGYTVTQLAPVAIIEHLRANDVPAGSTTPALLMGKDFASSLDGSSDIRVEESRSSD